MNHAGLVESVAAATGLSRAAAARAVGAVVDGVVAALQAGEEARVAGLGTPSRWRPAPPGRAQPADRRARAGRRLQGGAVPRREGGQGGRERARAAGCAGQARGQGRRVRAPRQAEGLPVVRPREVVAGPRGAPEP